jgi:CBS domain-containing protein
MAKTIREVMTTNPCTIDADKPVAYAAKMMRDEDVGLAPIVDGQTLIGSLTERDIAIRAVAEGKDPQSTTVREVSTTHLVTLDPDQGLDEALDLMAQNQVRRLPVLDQDGRLAGVVAQADVARPAPDKQTGEVVEEISKETRDRAQELNKGGPLARASLLTPRRRRLTRGQPSPPSRTRPHRRRSPVPNPRSRACFP